MTTPLRSYSRCLVPFTVHKASMKDFLEASYASGGVYPTLFGYFLGAVAIGFFLGAKHWFVRLTPASICIASFAHNLYAFESLALSAIFAFSALVGACCTYVQVSSWRLAFAHLESKRAAKRRLKHKMQ